MYSENITREEARIRADLVRPTAYRVLVDLTGRGPDGSVLADPEATFVSHSSVEFSSGAGSTWIDLLAESVLEATLDGEPLDAESYAGSRLPLELGEGDHELVVVGLCRYSHTGEGLHRFIDPADDRVYLYTQFEVADARRMYACFEQPSLKATFQLSVVAPANWTVISNAASVDPVVVPETDPLHGADEWGQAYSRWDFEPTVRISTYLTALVAGNYHRVHDTYTGPNGDIPLSILCRESMVGALDADRIFATTKKGFAVFEAAFGTPYPFGTYDQSFVPEFNAGAMENAGCVTHRDDYLFRSRVTAAAYEGRDNTILHEMAHMWFGDLVTMSWWDDLWLNESFAEWASHFAMAEYHEDAEQPWVTFANQRKTWAYRQDQLPTTHPIAADMVDLNAVASNFDGITYAKGASALRQLVAYVGRDNFLAGVRQYFADHAYGNTTLQDLFDALEAASGRDLSGWASEWLQVAGVSTLAADFDCDDAGTFTRFAVRQYVPQANPVTRTHRMAIGLYNRVDESTITRSRRIELDLSSEVTDVPELVGETRPDLVLLNDDDLTYAKVRLDGRSLATVVQHVGDIDSPLARAVCWGAAWDMTRDGEMLARDYLALVLQAVGQETDRTAVQRTLGQAQTALTFYAPEEHRPELNQQLEQGLARLVAGAEPGSDYQLTFVRALASAAGSDQAAEVVRAWYAGEEQVPGLEIDTDLRWHLLTQLARLGIADEAAIAAELERDHTITGEQRAAGARAARPDPVAKAEAWRLATAADDVANETQRSICLSFWRPGQEELLLPYADRFLDVVDVMGAGKNGWDRKGIALRENVLDHLFPSLVADEDFLARLDAFLAEHELTAPIRRSLAESRDDALRSLHARSVARAQERPVSVETVSGAAIGEEQQGGSETTDEVQPAIGEEDAIVSAEAEQPLAEQPPAEQAPIEQEPAEQEPAEQQTPTVHRGHEA
ncbi:Membrane alanyl aminopeptidase Metallo peptidase. MEROPS family M01 [Raineyella antarctica]|uniref:Aminopeptidase N n=1 Tax=Raineyella antarctica TaxID=1577474 RepID=A0A1G6H278_9ACTN|nr:aminopeptidase N [Raineyella antarctica]SDB88372.1 Membrane alanyl aminopeptidase Metallo peptidase. MEROPS family M01 [Raineyella antarctica]